MDPDGRFDETAPLIFALFAPLFARVPVRGSIVRVATGMVAIPAFLNGYVRHVYWSTARSGHSFVQAWLTAPCQPWPLPQIFATNGIRVYKELMVVSNTNSPPLPHNPSPLTSSRCVTTNQYSSNAPRAITYSVAEGKIENAGITSKHGIERWGGCRSGERVVGNEPLQLRSFSDGANRTETRIRTRLPLYLRRHAKHV